MIWVGTVERAGSGDSGLTPLTNGQKRESPVGSPDCMTFWPAGDSTEVTNSLASAWTVADAWASMPSTEGSTVSGFRKATLMFGFLNPAPIPAELWMVATLIWPVSSAWRGLGDRKRTR